MAKQKSQKLAPGTPVMVSEGVHLPEFPDQPIEGWTGTVVEQRGRGAELQYIIEWDDATVTAMPQTYRDHCEQEGLYFKMACLPASDVERAGSEG